MKWWLIGDEDVQIIRRALQSASHEANITNCVVKGGDELEDCFPCVGKKLRDEAFYRLDTGLHITDAVPSDFRVEGS